MLVRIIKNWDWPPLARQTPGKSGRWNGIQFTEEAADRSDYVVVLNSPAEAVTVQCPAENIWQIMQEPPVAMYGELHRGIAGARRVYTQDVTLVGAEYVHSHGALPWHVERTYDWLKQCAPPDKPRGLSWITSNLAFHQGHRERLKFLGAIRGKLEFDLKGKGFDPIDDKWDGIAPYRYTLVVENHRGPYYWSEKIADAFLAWTMPIYYGCTNIADFFPAEAFVQIDIHDADVAERIREAVASERWVKNRDAIGYARELVLDKHQFFPFVAREIRETEARGAGAAEGADATVTLEPILPRRLPMARRLRQRLHRLVKKKYTVRRSS